MLLFLLFVGSEMFHWKLSWLCVMIIIVVSSTFLNHCMHFCFCVVNLVPFVQTDSLTWHLYFELGYHGRKDINNGNIIISPLPTHLPQRFVPTRATSLKATPGGARTVRRQPIAAKTQRSLCISVCWNIFTLVLLTETVHYLFANNTVVFFFYLKLSPCMHTRVGYRQMHVHTCMYTEVV